MENATYGMLISDDSVVHADRIEISGTEPSGTDGLSYGVAVGDSSTLRMTDTDIGFNSFMGMYISGPGTSVTMTGGAIHDTAQAPDGSGGDGVVVYDGARFRARRGARFDDNAFAQILTLDIDTPYRAHVKLEDVSTSCATRSDQQPSKSRYGIWASGNVDAELTNIDVQGCDRGVVIDGTEGSGAADLTDVRIEAASTGSTVGLQIYSESSGEVEVVADALTVGGPFLYGVWGDGHGSSATVNNAALRDASFAGLGVSETIEDAGIVFYATGGADLSVEHVVVERTLGIGAVADGGGTTLSLNHVRISDTLPLIGDYSTSTYAVIAQDSARVSVTASSITNTYGEVLLAADGGGIETANVDIVGCSGEQSYGAIASDSVGKTTYIDLTDTNITACAWGGVVATGTKASATLNSVNISGSEVSIYVLDQAYVSVTDTTLEDQSVGVYIDGDLDADWDHEETITDMEATNLTITGATVLDERPSAGIATLNAGRFRGSNVTIGGIAGPGIYSANAAVSCDTCTIQNTDFAGVAATDGSGVTLTATKISGARYSSSFSGGVGIFATGGPNYDGSYVSFTEGGEIHDTDLAGVYVTGPGAYIFED